jgi:hypothetical protein
VASAYINAVGCLTPHGVGPDALLEETPFPRRAVPAQLEGRDVPGLPDAGWIDPIPRPQRWHGRRVRFGRLDRLTRLAMVAAHHAVDAASLPEDRERAGIVFGTAYGCHLSNEGFQLQLEQLPPDEVSPSLFTYTLPSAAVGEISIHLGLKGATVTLTEGIGAGVAAVALAGRLVARGDATWMLAGAAEALGPTLLAAGPDAPMSEGSIFLVVSSEPRGALARIRGGGEVAEPNRLVYDAAELPWQRELGRSGAAAPLLGLGRLLLSAPSRRLPASVEVRDRWGSASVLCVDVP